MKRKPHAISFLAAGLLLLAGLIAPAAPRRAHAAREACGLCVAGEDVWGSALTNPSFQSRLGPEFRISNLTSPECVRYAPAVAYNWVQREYLVVWHNWWSNSYQDIYARRVISTGELKSWFSVAAIGKSRRYPSVAHNATNGEYLVVWMYDAKGDSIHWEIWGRRVAWDGSWMGPEFQIFTWPNRSFENPCVTWNSYRNEYLVVANARDTTTDLSNDVAGRRVKADGATPYPGHNISSQDQTLQPHDADVTYNIATDEYLVVWRQYWSGNNWGIHGARVRGDNGAVVNPPGTFSICAASDYPADPAVATNQQDRYLVVWELGTGTPLPFYYIVRGQELNTSGSPVGGVITLSFPGQFAINPDAAINGGTNERFVVWWQPTATGGEIWGLGWNPSAMIIIWVPFRIAPGTAEVHPVVASGPPGYLVVYGKSEGSAMHIYGRLYWPETVYLPLTLKDH